MSADLWRPLEKLRQQVDHLFDDFNRSPVPSPFGHVLFDVEPFWRRELIGHGMPAVDITEKDKSYEITAELPGMDQTTLTPDAVTLGQPFQCFVLGVPHGFNADERLAAFLLNLSQRLSVRGYSGTRFVLKMRREEIASYNGSAPGDGVPQHRPPAQLAARHHQQPQCRDPRSVRAHAARCRLSSSTDVLYPPALRYNVLPGLIANTLHGALCKSNSAVVPSSLSRPPCCTVPITITSV